MYSLQPAYSWAGFYVGANAGYGWGSQDPLALVTNKFDSANINTNGGVFGGTAGAQLQQGHVVLGVEGDLDWADISGSRTLTPTVLGVPAAPGFTVGLKADVDWEGTARMRIGWAQDNWLFYSTAGLAMLGAQPQLTTLDGLGCANVNLKIPNCGSNQLKGGLAAGLGVEYGITPNWSAKLEYLYIGQIQGLSTLNLIRVGVNYRFGG